MMHEEVAKYRELSGDTNPNTPISRIGGYLDGYEKALEQTGWIPVSERLPEVMYGSGGDCSDDVLICVKSDENATISTGFYGYYPCSQSEQGWWSVWALGCKKIEEEVIAWMPLPKPYEPQEEVQE